MNPPKVRQECDDEITGSFPTVRSCIQSFAKIESAVSELSRQVESLADDVKEFSKLVISHSQSLESVWETIREEILPQTRGFTDKMDDRVADHEKFCPALRRAMRRAEGLSTDSDTKISVKEVREKNGKFTIPKIVVYIGVGVGVALAVGGYVLAYLINNI